MATTNRGALEVETDEPGSPIRNIVCSSKGRLVTAVIISFVVVIIVILSVILTIGRSNEVATVPTVSPLRNTTQTDQVTNTDSPPVSTNCDRICTPGDIRTCSFKWNVSYYYSLINNRTDRPCGYCPFNITDCYWSECIPLNGLRRPLVTVNRQVPGPKIVVCKNDIIEVTVNNYLDDMTGITFHWHGITQRGTPAMDGPSMITQCPIPFGLSFIYKFKADDAGTYFWHSHIGSNRADGLAGPIIVRDPQDPHAGSYDFDLTNHTLMIQDWMNIIQNTNYIKYLYFGGENRADFILINGRGKGPVLLNPKNSSSQIAYTPREVLTVEKGKRYRIRLISNAFTGCPMKVSVDNHSLAAISMDSFPINMVPFDSLISNAGERFDFILNANNTIDNYWLRVEGIGDSCISIQELAIVRYQGAPEMDPEASENRTIDAGIVLNPSERQIRLYKKSVPIVNVTSLVSFRVTNKISTYYLHVGVNEPKTGDFALRDGLPQINHITFAYPPVPLLTQHNEVNQSLFCDAGEASTWTQCTKERCSCAQMITAELGETIELFFYNGIFNGTYSETTACHPMHLHGFDYRVVGSGLMNTNYTVEQVEKMDKNGRFPRLGSSFPPIRDTVCVAHGSYMILRFVVDNPGWWFLHCHLSFHTLVGMAMVVRAGTDEDVRPLIPRNFPKCRNFT